MTREEAQKALVQVRLLAACTDKEIEAYHHAAERVKDDGSHSTSGCPIFCRAMCSYEPEIKAMLAKGIEVPS